MGTGTDMNALPENAVVVNARAGVDNAAGANTNVNVHDRSGNYYGAGFNRGASTDYCTWMDDRRETDTFGF